MLMWKTSIRSSHDSLLPWDWQVNALWQALTVAATTFYRKIFKSNHVFATYFHEPMSSKPFWVQENRPIKHNSYMKWRKLLIYVWNHLQHNRKINTMIIKMIRDAYHGITNPSVFASKNQSFFEYSDSKKIWIK